MSIVLPCKMHHVQAILVSLCVYVLISYFVNKYNEKGGVFFFTVYLWHYCIHTTVPLTFSCEYVGRENLMDLVKLFDRIDYIAEKETYWKKSDVGVT